jgi:hypothetical protein
MPRWALALLLLVVIVGAALRVWDASQGLSAGEHFDERFSLKNVGGILNRGDWQPSQAYYPSLSYLPQTAVLFASETLARWSGDSRLAVHGDTADGWTATAYLLARLTNVVFGTLSLLLVFVVGHRLFGPAEGLLAAAALAAFPRHLISSTHFKPDILVTLLMLLTFHWTLRAAARPTTGAFARVGLGIGLATSSKYTGAGSALAPALLALLRRRDRRYWAWLALAAGISVATFVALNPFLPRLLLFAQNLSQGYAKAGADEGSDHWTVLRREGSFLLVHHGWVAAFLVLGLLGLAWAIARRPVVTAAADAAVDGRDARTEHATEPPWTAERRTGAILLLGQIVSYALLFAVGFPLFRGQNFLPVAPFTSLVAAWAMVALYRWLARRRPALATPPARAALLALPLLLLLWGQLAEVYGRVVPTTWSGAGELVSTSLDQLPVRQVVYEGAPGLVRTGGKGPLMLPVPSLAAAGDMARLADADLGPAPRDAAAGPALRLLAPRWFRSRGTTLALRLHPWTAGGEQEIELTPAPHGGLVAALQPALAPGTVVSLSLWLPRTIAAPDALVLEPAGAILPLYLTERREGDVRLLAPRFVVTPGVQRLRVPALQQGPRPPRLEATTWSLR